MFEPSTSYASKDKQLLKRNDSFSTFSSSLADDDVKQQYSNLAQNRSKKTESQIPTVVAGSPANVQFDKSDGIHVGDVVYHIHHHSPEDDPNENPKSASNSSTLGEFKKPKKDSKKKLLLNSVWLLPIILSVVSIIVGVSVVVYYLWGNNQDNNESTTEYITTDDTTAGDTTTTPSNILPKYFVTRENWGAEQPKSSNIPYLESPVKRIIIGHTRGNSCINEVECISTVKSIQTEDSSLDDIAYNFLIGGDERVYEGRGFNFTGQHTENIDATEYNSIGICIAFIGNYTSTVPYSGLINLLKNFISTFVELNLIANDHIIVLQDDLKYFEPKADALNEAIKSLDKFRPLYKILRREEWIAEQRKDLPQNYSRIMDWVLIGHTVTPLCNDLSACKARARSLQEYDMSFKGYNDIMYNIFFGGDGYAFEGRGWDFHGELHVGLNDKVIATGVIGEFTSIPPNDYILNAILRVLDDAMALGKLTDDYRIFGRSDFRGPEPGEAFMTIIRTWCRYGNGTSSC